MTLFLNGYGPITSSRLFRFRFPGLLWMITWVMIIGYSVITGFNLVDSIGRGVAYVILPLVFHGILFLGFSVMTAISMFKFYRERLLMDETQITLVNMIGSLLNLISFALFIVWIAAYNPDDGEIKFKEGREENYISFGIATGISSIFFFIHLSIVFVLWTLGYYFSKVLEIQNLLSKEATTDSLTDRMEKVVNFRLHKMTKPIDTFPKSVQLKKKRKKKRSNRKI